MDSYRELLKKQLKRTTCIKGHKKVTFLINLSIYFESYLNAGCTTSKIFYLKHSSRRKFEVKGNCGRVFFAHFCKMISFPIQIILKGIQYGTKYSSLKKIS